MSKDFEQAYRELAENEAPKLWERIEAGLSDRRSTQTESAKEPDAERSEAEKKEGVSRKKKALSKEYLFRLRKYSAMAAAVICVIIILPIFFRVNRGSGHYESSGAAESAASGDTAAQEADESAAESENIILTGNTAAAQGSVQQENMTAESAEAAEEEAEEGSSGSGDGMRDLTAETGAGSMAEADRQEDTAAQVPAEDAEKKSMQSAKREDEILSHVIVEVTECESIPAGGSLKEGGTVYTAVVQRDPEGVLAEGEEIAVFIPAYSSVALIKDGVFELDLGRKKGENYSYIVCGYHGHIEE